MIASGTLTCPQCGRETPWPDRCMDHNQLPPAAPPATQTAGMEERDYKKLYYELLYAVGNKWPDETRHQTALRYIQNAERGSNIAAGKEG